MQAHTRTHARSRTRAHARVQTRARARTQDLLGRFVSERRSPKIAKQYEAGGVTLDSFRRWVMGEIIGEDFYTWSRGHPTWDDISLTAIHLGEW